MIEDQEIRPSDHPDFVGGWVWTDEEIRWIKAFAKVVEQRTIERCAQAAGPEDSYQDEWFKAKADAVNRIRALGAK